MSPGKHSLPFVALLLLLAFNSFRPDLLIPGGRILTYIPTALTGLLLMLWGFSKKKTISNIQTKLLILLCIFIVLQLPFARNGGASYIVVKGFIIYQFTLYLFLVQFIDRFELISKYIRLYTIFAVFPAVIGLFGGGDVSIPMLSDENDFCLFVNCMIPFSFFLAMESQNVKKKLFYLFLTLIFIIANIASFSRGGFVGLVAIALYLFWDSKHKLFYILLIGIVGGGVVYYAPPGYLNEINSIDSSSYKHDTGAERLISWKAAWEIFKDHPIVGVGVNNYGSWVPDYWQGEYRSGESMWGRMAHSLYFTLLSELGLVGCVIFTGMLTGNFIEHRFICTFERNNRRYLGGAGLEEEKKSQIKKEIRELSYFSKAYCGAMIGYLVTGGFISVLWYSYFWMLTAFWVLTGNYARNLQKMLDVQPDS